MFKDINKSCKILQLKQKNLTKKLNAIADKNINANKRSNVAIYKN